MLVIRIFLFGICRPMKTFMLLSHVPVGGMGPVNMRLVEQAKSIFADLGYTVEGDGPEFRAERAWKVVHVSAVLERELQLTETGDFHCFVARPEDADDLERRLEREDPAYEWAIIVANGTEYEVERAPPGPIVTV